MLCNLSCNAYGPEPLVSTEIAKKSDTFALADGHLFIFFYFFIIAIVVSFVLMFLSFCAMCNCVGAYADLRVESVRLKLIECATKVKRKSFSDFMFAFLFFLRFSFAHFKKRILSVCADLLLLIHEKYILPFV